MSPIQKRQMESSGIIVLQRDGSMCITLQTYGGMRGDLSAIGYSHMRKGKLITHILGGISVGI